MAEPLFSTRHRGLAKQLARLEGAVDSDSTILVLGAPGTGKDRFARLVHERSRPGEPFIRVDLAAVSDDLFESELFGHEKGSFTGAFGVKPGLLEGAGAGTIYLDRIDTLSLRAQGKLLRVLEERVLLRVGGRRAIPIAARFLASAAPDLPRRARSGEFRDDLFYRLAVVTVSLPTLAERRGDLLAGARAIARETAGRRALTPAARNALLAHPWRGNWRELENAIRRAAIEAKAQGEPALDASHIRLSHAGEPEAVLSAAVDSGWTLRKLTDAYIALVLEESGGNVAEAARRLGVARKTLYERRLPPEEAAVKIRFVFVGKNDDGEYARGIERYVARTSRFVPAEVVVVREERGGAKADAARILAEEGKRIAAVLKPRDLVILCDASGKEVTSEELQAAVRKWLDSGASALVFVVGGAFGLSRDLTPKARGILPLSRLTLPHQLARVVLAEQVYRAVATLHGVAYSK